ncbi:MAG: hypothetical protein ACXVFU_10110 [Nocardioidaceae bacterium]
MSRALAEPSGALLEVEDAAEPPSPVSSRGVVRAAWALIALQAAVRAWVGFHGYLSQDDYPFEFRAATMPVLSHHYLLDAWNGHLMPGSFLLVWVATKLAPLEVWPTVAMDLVLQAAIGLVLLALLRELFGTRRAILVPLTLFLFSAATLGGFAWWAAALNQLPAMLAMVSTLLLHVRYLRTGRTRTALAALLAFLLGLACFEKMLLFAPLVLLFTASYAVPGTWGQRLRGAVRLHLRVWLAWLAVLLPYTAYYRTHVRSTVTGTTTPSAFLDLAGTSWQALRATVLGGPWTWSWLGDPTNEIPVVGGLLAAVSWVVVILVVGGSAAVYRQAGRAWLPPALYGLATAALLALGRNQLGPVIGLAYRYYSEVALLAAIALALATLPIIGTFAVGEVTVLTPRSWVTSLTARLALSPSSNTRTVLVRGVVVALVLSSALSTTRFDAGWRQNPGRPYLTTLRADLARAPDDLVLSDLSVPPAVMSPLFLPYNSLSHVLAPLPDAPRFLRAGGTSTSLHAVDDSGHVRLAAVEGDRARTGPVAGCGWFAHGEAGASVPLAVRTFDYDWTVRIGYLASEATRATITAGDRTFAVQLDAGLHALYLRTSGAFDAVRIEGLTPSASVCTDDVRVGVPTALPG